MSRSPIAGRILLAVTEKLRKSRGLKRLAEIEKTPFLSKPEVEAMQLRDLQKLLAHAETRVPYYRELFRKLKITSRDFQTLRDLERLPVLTKDIVRERQNDLIREDVDRASLRVHYSGGSTGVPLTFYRESAYMDDSKAGEYRIYMQSGWRPGEMVAFFWGGNDQLYKMRPWEFEVRQRLRRYYLLDPFYSGPEEMDRWIAKWSSIGATIASGYASTLARFAQHVESRGRRLPPLKGVFSTAEKLYPHQREVISRVFGCHVFDYYGSSEVQNIAAECPSGGMHVQADFVIVEADRSSNRPVAPGEPSPLLVTSLRNFAMPFIRYRNEDCGDLAAPSAVDCPCGSHFPLMQLRVSRVSDNFRLPSGRVVHGEFFTHLMYGSRGIETFQFHQTAPDAITLWIVPVAGDSSLQEARATAIRNAVEQVRTLDGPGGREIRVEVRETGSIARTAAGKHRFVRSDVQS
jgi:phenylacetate-CoA ligase